MVDKKISVIGLGLIGGSIVKALKERMNITNIAAVDNNIKSLNQALEEGYIARGFSKLDEYIFDSDIILYVHLLISQFHI